MYREFNLGRVGRNTTLALLAATATALFCGSVASASGVAYVISGNDADGDETTQNDKAAGSAADNYEAKGYTVIRLNQPTRAQIIQAFLDPQAQAVWMVGHGGRDADGNWVPYFAHNTKAPPDGEPGITPDKLGPVPLGHLQNVVIHGCGQALPGWENKFPNAEFTSWSDSVSGWTIRMWEYWFGGLYIPQKNGASPETGTMFNLLFVDPRLTETVPFGPIPFSPGLLTDLGRTDFMSFGFTMPPDLAARVGTLSFNVLMRNPNDLGETQLLGGLTFDSGVCVARNDDGFVDPDFVYVLDPQAYMDAVGNIDTIRGAFDTGTGHIEGNTTGAGDRDLFSAASMMLFGVTAGGADLNGDGVVSGADLALLLGTWGDCPDMPGCPGDLNADGMVDGIDLAILLGAWG